MKKMKASLSTLTDIKNVVRDVGLEANVCPINRHVVVRHDDMDESYIALLVPAEGGVKEDDAIHDTDGSIIAKTPRELVKWLKEKSKP